MVGIITKTITKNTSLSKVLKLGQECNNTQEKCRLCCAFSSGLVINDDIKRIASHLGLSEKEFKEKYLDEVNEFNQKLHKLKTIKEQGRPYGRCVFFIENNEKNETKNNEIKNNETKNNETKQRLCKIHNFKPLHCRIANCNENGELLHQWFIVNYVLSIDDPECMRQWNSYITAIKSSKEPSHAVIPAAVPVLSLIPGGSFEELVPDKRKRDKILSYGLLFAETPHEEYRKADELLRQIQEKDSAMHDKFREEFMKKLPEIKKRLAELEAKEAGEQREIKKQTLRLRTEAGKQTACKIIAEKTKQQTAGVNK